MLWIVLPLLVAIAVAAVCFVNQPSFGRLPRGERLERIKRSPQYRDGRFHNLIPTEVMASGKSKAAVLADFLLGHVDELRPDKPLPAVKTDLNSLPPGDDVVVWLGHSTCYVQIGGVRILVDPVLVGAAPVSILNRPFPGSDLYTPDDIPPLDYMLVTHDHWDHLDYRTVMALKDRTKAVICPLGVGEHFEYWGFAPDRIIELDWGGQADLGGGLLVDCLPARHFSGRGLFADRSLWASFLLSSSKRRIYISGDTGYDEHFARIREQFGPIDFALMENGQYNEDWSSIHLMPGDLVRAVTDLQPMRFMTVHNSKYALGKHSWHDPMDRIAVASEEGLPELVTPRIGEPVDLDAGAPPTQRWWETPAGE